MNRQLSVLLLSLWASIAWGDDISYSEQAVAVNSQVVIAGLVDLQALKESHPGRVLLVDLRTEAEGTADEATEAAALGIGYTNIPVSSVTVDPGQVTALRDAIAGAEPDALVVVHCASGNRAGMLWGAAQLQEGESLTSVRERLEGVLNKQPAIDGLTAFAESLDAEP